LARALILIHEVGNASGQLAAVDVAAPAELSGNDSRNVARPLFCGIEADHPDWAAVLAVEQIGDEGIKIGRSF
jgi:hypothetical protein